MKRQAFSMPVLGALALILGSCAMDYGDEALMSDDVGVESAALSEHAYADDGPTTEAAYDCYVSIQCANGTSKACSGSNGSCSASSSSNGRVTCNGVTYQCSSLPPPPPSECDTCPPGYSCHCGIFDGCIRDTYQCP